MTNPTAPKGKLPRVWVNMHRISEEYLSDGEPNPQAHAYTKQEIEYRTPDGPINEYLSLAEAALMCRTARAEERVSVMKQILRDMDHLNNNPEFDFDQPAKWQGLRYCIEQEANRTPPRLEAGASLSGEGDGDE